MKAKLKKDNIIVILYVFLFFSCKVDNAFYFDIASQTICSCEKSFYKLSINNDSVASNGCQYEGGILLMWNDTVNPPPSKIRLDSIPDKYNVYVGGYNFSKKIKLRQNSTYTLSNNGMGGIAFRVKIRTDSIGRGIKATRTTCDSDKNT